MFDFIGLLKNPQKTYERELKKASLERGLKYAALLGLIPGILIGIIILFAGTLIGVLIPKLAGLGLLIAIAVPIILTVVMVASRLANTGIAYLIATKILGGKADFGKLFFLDAATQYPVLISLVLIGWLHLIGWILVAAFALYLQYNLYKAVFKFELEKFIALILISILIDGLIALLCGFAIGGAVIGLHGFRY